MNLPEFGVEAWLNKWEKSAKYDISQSSIDSLTLEEINTFYKVLDKIRNNLE